MWVIYLIHGLNLTSTEIIFDIKLIHKIKLRFTFLIYILPLYYRQRSTLIS